MSYEEAAYRYAQALPVPPRVVKLPLGLIRFAGQFSPSLEYNARIMKTVLDYYETFKASDAWDELGRPVDDHRGVRPPAILNPRRFFPRACLAMPGLLPT